MLTEEDSGTVYYKFHLYNQTEEDSLTFSFFKKLNLSNNDRLSEADSLTFSFKKSKK